MLKEEPLNGSLVRLGPLFLPRKEADGKSYVKYEVCSLPFSSRNGSLPSPSLTTITPKVIGPNQVAVPTHFFKILLVAPLKGPPRVQAFVMPNQSIPSGLPLANYLVPLEEIEKSAGGYSSCLLLSSRSLRRTKGE